MAVNLSIELTLFRDIKKPPCLPRIDVLSAKIDVLSAKIVFQNIEEKSHSKQKIYQFNFEKLFFFLFRRDLIICWQSYSRAADEWFEWCMETQNFGIMTWSMIINNLLTNNNKNWTAWWPRQMLQKYVVCGGGDWTESKKNRRQGAIIKGLKYPMIDYSLEKKNFGIIRDWRRQTVSPKNKCAF